MSSLRATLERKLALVVASGILERSSHPPPLCELRIGDEQIDFEAEANGTNGKCTRAGRMPALQGSEPEGLTSEEVSYIGDGRDGGQPPGRKN